MQYLNWTFSKYEKKYNGDYVIDFSKEINNDLLSNPNNIVRYIDTSIITSPRKSYFTNDTKVICSFKIVVGKFI